MTRFSEIQHEIAVAVPESSVLKAGNKSSGAKQNQDEPDALLYPAFAVIFPFPVANSDDHAASAAISVERNDISNDSQSAQSNSFQRQIPGPFANIPRRPYQRRTDQVLGKCNEKDNDQDKTFKCYDEVKVAVVESRTIPSPNHPSLEDNPIGTTSTTSSSRDIDGSNQSSGMQGDIDVDSKPGNDNDDEDEDEDEDVHECDNEDDDDANVAHHTRKNIDHSDQPVLPFASNNVWLEQNVFYGKLCWKLYLRSLQLLPSNCKTWWSNIDRSSNHAVNLCTQSAFSPLLVHDEILSVNQSDDHIEQKPVKSKPAPSLTMDDAEESEFSVIGFLEQQEIIAKYQKSDISMTLVCKFNRNHPLLPVIVEFPDRIRVKEQQVRSWQLSIQNTMMNQNGTIIDAISTWRHNLDKQFEGMEPCPICYAVVHDQNRSLPKMKCPQCKHKFHNQCLYKWFNTSATFKCPMCRSLF
jgi:hypothetical protein